MSEYQELASGNFGGAPTKYEEVVSSMLPDQDTADLLEALRYGQSTVIKAATVLKPFPSDIYEKFAEVNEMSETAEIPKELAEAFPELITEENLAFGRRKAAALSKMFRAASALSAAGAEYGLATLEHITARARQNVQKAAS